MISLRSINHQIVLGTVALSAYSFCEPPKLVASVDIALSIYSFCEPSERVASVDGHSDDSTPADTIDPKLSLGSHKAKLADVTLHYVVAGQGPLVLVTSPGWGIGSLYLQRGLAPLERTFTVVYLDTRGSGESSRPADTKQMSMAVMADDIDRFRSYLGLDSIKLMGHSNGGAIALDYAERYPQRVKKVVLIDTEVLDDREPKATQRYLTLWHDDPRFKHAVEVAQNDPTEDTDEQFEANLAQILPLYFSDPTRYLPVFEQQYAGSHLSVFAENAQDAADKLAPRYQSREYDKVQAKTLIITGTVDWVCPVEVSERMQTRIAGSRLSLYANVGHFPYIEEPARFFSEVSQFLAN
jgi:proline iminopeptidase